ncbi:MAG TPA: bifunctional salicylyl-CoA 5-hydroxylase/oxidoreductase, partial [Acidimicrobiia bacterium]|nr:bifunctional salicylyl-CoA 5-hydroxylase/oxidoreductase [Acidimicrobiia bacterium]
AWPLVAASAEPYTSRSRLPEALDEAGLAALADAYGTATARAAGAGVDVLVLDASDGYLLAGFLSPLANHRRDGWAGSLEASARFPLDVLRAVRAAWPEDRPLAVRLVADDRAPGGLTPDDGVALARLFVAGGCRLVDVTAGHSRGDERSAADYRRLYNVGLADQVRNEAGVIVMVGGHITRLDEVDTIVAAGRADLCVLDPRLYGGGICS